MKCVKIFVCVFLLFSFALLSGCISPPGKESNGSESETEFVPAPVLEDDDADIAKYTEYKEKIPLAFSGMFPALESDFEYTVLDDGMSVVVNKYLGKEKVVVVPEYIHEKKVVSIAEAAFENSLLRAAYLPDSIENIGRGAFAGCQDLTTLRLPIIGGDSEHENAGYIFGAITSDSNSVSVPKSLTTIIYGEKVTYIPDNSFAGFKSVEAISFEGTVNGIGEFAFYENSSLIYVGSQNFRGDVGKYAFAECKSLVHVELGSDIEKIGIGTFLNCSSVKSLTLPFVGGGKDENQYIGYIFGAENVEWNMYFVPGSLRKIILLESCDTIANMAFSNCGQICSIILPETIKEIGMRAFYKCSSLREMTIPKSVGKIGADAFFMCWSLAEIHFDKDANVILENQVFFMCSSLESVAFPDSVGRIPSSMFYGCDLLKIVEGKGISSIEKDAFYSCGCLESVVTIDESKIESGNMDYINAMNKK